MTWHTGPMLSFDTETTGTDPLDARIVTACITWIEPGKTTSVASWLLNPDVEIPADAVAIHGITTDRARKEGADPATMLPVIATDLVQAWRDGLPVIVMNAAYDLTVLDCELRRHGQATLHDRLLGAPMLVVDPLVCDRALDRYRRGKKRLEDLCRVYRVALEDAHTADADALAAARVAWRMAEKYPRALAVDLVELQTLQAGWHRDWAEHFEVYMRENVDPDCQIERDWPIRSEVPA